MVLIADYIHENQVIKLDFQDKKNALKELINKIKAPRLLPNPETFLFKILEREQKCSTAIGLGIAIPHIRLENLDSCFMGVGISEEGIDFNAPDHSPVHLIFLVAATVDHSNYLKLVARISWLVRNDTLRNQLFRAKLPHELYELLQKY